MCHVSMTIEYDDDNIVEADKSAKGYSQVNWFRGIDIDLVKFLKVQSKFRYFVQMKHFNLINLLIFLKNQHLIGQ